MKQGWEIRKLGEVCDIICGQDYKSVRDDNGKYPIYGTGGIMGYASQYRCPANSVIIGRKGSINNPLFVDTEFWNVDTAFGVVPNEDILHPKFFYLFCKDYDFTRHDVSVTIPSLRRTDILKINVPIPPIAEQEKIVTELDCLSGIIEKKKQQLKELDNLAQSIFYEMFGDPVGNDKGWERLLFEKCIEKVRYTAKIATCNYATTGTFPIISQEEDYISGYWNNAEDVFMISKPVVIFGDHTRVLKYVDFDFVMGADGVKILQPIDTINAKFFLYYLIASKIPSLGYSRHYKLLKELKVLLPPLSLQQDFASKIESIEKQKELIVKSIKETETLFNSRMDYYFA